MWRSGGTRNSLTVLGGTSTQSSRRVTTTSISRPIASQGLRSGQMWAGGTQHGRVTSRGLNETLAWHQGGQWTVVSPRVVGHSPHPQNESHGCWWLSGALDRVVERSSDAGILIRFGHAGIIAVLGDLVCGGSGFSCFAIAFVPGAALVICSRPSPSVARPHAGPLADYKSRIPGQGQLPAPSARRQDIQDAALRDGDRPGHMGSEATAAAQAV